MYLVRELAFVAVIVGGLLTGCGGGGGGGSSPPPPAPNAAPEAMQITAKAAVSPARASVTKRVMNSSAEI